MKRLTRGTNAGPIGAVVSRSRYLVLSGNGEAPTWHDDYSSALADVRRRLGLVVLHHTKGRTRRHARQPSSQSFVHEGTRWSTVHVEEYDPIGDGPRVTVYYLQEQRPRTTGRL